jgi:hypothetical protein
MSVSLTPEQFTALLDKTGPKKFSKAELAKRKNVMDIDEFINNMSFIKVSKLAGMELPDFVVLTITETTNKMEDEELPFVCSNHQTKSFYYKDKGEWVKGHDFIKNIYNKIYKNALQQIIKKYNINDDNSDGNDENTEKRYLESRDCEKQRILCNLCNIDKYPYDKLIDKILLKLGRILKQNN